MKLWLFSIIAAVAVIGCNNSHTVQTRNVQGKLLSFTDFDLQTVVGVVKQDKVKGASELEKFINDDNGVNNVDVDKDGKIDFVRVVESREGETIVLDMKAVPSSGGSEVTVASLRFSQSAGGMDVQGGYPNYVDGYRNNFYSYNQPRRRGMSVGDAVFLAWLLTPSRTMYVQPMRAYSPRPVYSQSSLTSRRTTTRSTTKVSPVKNTTRPKTFAVKSAAKTQSRLKTQGTSAFQKRSATAPKKTATGFNSKKPAPKAAKPKSKSSWGSSSGKSRSSGSRSRSRSSGSRRRSSIDYKDNVQDFNVGLNAIKQMNAVTWDWKDDSSEPRIGFIAEDMERIFPQAVIRDATGKIDGIDYSLIIMPLVQSVQELQQEVNSLRDSCQ